MAEHLVAGSDELPWAGWVRYALAELPRFRRLADDLSSSVAGHKDANATNSLRDARLLS